MLTRRQHHLLTYLRDRRAKGGKSPSFDEMAKALGLRSKGGVHRLVSGLEQRGRIRRLAHRARAIEIVDMPSAAAQLLNEVLASRAAALVEHFHPGWCARARAFLQPGGGTGDER